MLQSKNIKICLLILLLCTYLYIWRPQRSINYKQKTDVTPCLGPTASTVCPPLSCQIKSTFVYFLRLCITSFEHRWRVNFIKRLALGAKTVILGLNLIKRLGAFFRFQVSSQVNGVRSLKLLLFFGPSFTNRIAPNSQQEVMPNSYIFSMLILSNLVTIRHMWRQRHS